MEKVSDYLKIRREDLNNNPTARVAICLCLDVSGSMGTVERGDFKLTGKIIFRDGQNWSTATGGITRLDELQEGVKLFYDEISQDEIAQFAAEICIVTFANTAECKLDFANVYRQEVPELELGEMTSMGEGVNLALDLLEKRKQEFKDAGVDYFQPWLVLMTDGNPNGDSAELARAMERTNKMISEKKLTLFPIGVGEDANLDVLAKFTPKRNSIQLKELKFKEFFEWLSSSVEETSKSMPGEKVQYNLKAISEWGSKYSLNTRKVEPWPAELPLGGAKFFKCGKLLKLQ
ncbi:MAG: VWA domain-containing protein [Selenomonadaceae bacterium]|nr:VWA domain-containing protein [Selenomonadaceae bacterium]